VILTDPSRVLMGRSSRFERAVEGQGASGGVNPAAVSCERYAITLDGARDWMASPGFLCGQL